MHIYVFVYSYYVNLYIFGGGSERKDLLTEFYLMCFLSIQGVIIQFIVIFQQISLLFLVIWKEIFG